MHWALVIITAKIAANAAKFISSLNGFSNAYAKGEEQTDYVISFGRNFAVFIVTAVELSQKHFSLTLNCTGMCV